MLKLTCGILLLCVLNSQLIGQNVRRTNPGCREFETNGQCAACSFSFYMDVSRICQPVNPNCKTYNSMNGDCTSCYQGWAVVERTCLPSPKNQNDPNCRRYQDNNCIQCSQGFYFNGNGVCTQVDPSCRTYDSNNGACTSCYVGFGLSGGQCLAGSVIDLNCNRFFEDGSCQICSNGYYKNNQGRCTATDPTCADFDYQFLTCRACYIGFALQNGRCVQDKNSQDPFCKQFGLEGCLRCADGYYYLNGRCTGVDPNCRFFDYQNYVCRGCYTGYVLSEFFNCIEDQSQSLIDPLCAQFLNGVCVRCAEKSYFNNGICMAVDPQCSIFDNVNLNCLECYTGYRLFRGSCIQDNSNSLCAQWQGSICLRCAQGSEFSNQGVCVEKDALCRVFNDIGVCIGCYVGYAINPETQTCMETQEQSSNPYCAEWDYIGQNSICLRCAIGSVFDQNGQCTLRDPLCRTYDLNGVCVQCFQGYAVFNGQCVEALSDPACAEFNQNGDCIKCATRHYFSQGRCIQISPFCQDFDYQARICISCFTGFVFQNGNCVQASAEETDPFCAKLEGSTCIECARGTTFLNGICTVLNPLCKTQVNGFCTSCYIGYVVSQGNCVVDENFENFDKNCQQFQDNNCVRCSQGFVFGLDGKCTATDPLCRDYDSRAFVCLSCYQGYTIVAGRCQIAEEEEFDQNCAQFDSNSRCVRCSKGFAFSQNGQCIILNPLCASYTDSYECNSCYEGYLLQQGNCFVDTQYKANNGLCAQFFDGFCVRCANRAYMGNNGQCIEVSVDCKTYDIFDGQCTTCYPGFGLSRGSCFKSTTQDFCSKIDESGICVQCAPGTFTFNGQCIEIDTQCADFDQETLQCLGCYSGYSLLNGFCEISQVQRQAEVEHCYVYTPDNFCLQCLNGYYLINNKCELADVFCKTYQMQGGRCTSCYTSFTLVNGKCIN